MDFVVENTLKSVQIELIQETIIRVNVLNYRFESYSEIIALRYSDPVDNLFFISF